MVFNPIAVCLLQSADKSRLEIGVHQVITNNPQSIQQYASTGENRDRILIHHVVLFTSLSYAECQTSIRKRIASSSGAEFVGRSKEIKGDQKQIVSAMTRISLDSSWLTKDSYCPSSSRKRGRKNESSSDNLDDFIVDDSESESESDDDDSQ
jgi:hypothetical protein